MSGDAIDLRRHIAVDHHQGRAAYDDTQGLGVPSLDFLALWHDLEHQPTGYGTHLDHAHDEVSARRYVVPRTSEPSHTAQHRDQP